MIVFHLRWFWRILKQAIDEPFPLEFPKVIVISRRALAREGDYEMMPVCACVR